MEIDDGACSSSDEDVRKEIKPKPHTATLDLDFDTEQTAQMICRIVSVDKEPDRSNAVRSFKVQGSHLLIEIRSEDRKSLQKSIANLLDMCDLAKSTIDLVTKKKWLDLRAPVEKKLKLNSANST